MGTTQTHLIVSHFPDTPRDFGVAVSEWIRERPTVPDCARAGAFSARVLPQINEEARGGVFFEGSLSQAGKGLEGSLFLAFSADAHGRVTRVSGEGPNHPFSLNPKPCDARAGHAVR
jgi:hypothetical protein